MSEQTISRANLSYIENNLKTLSNNLVTVANNIEVVSNQVGRVDTRVNSMETQLANLANEFEIFVNESKRIANLADAKQTIALLEQELKNKFGNYDKVRKHAVGILQASDVSIVKKETIETATEEMMISTPRYWLAPALIALSAWLSDNKELADKALKEAIKRDDEKTSLLFCLISRRAGKLDGSVVWLERYFSMQDPSKMERRIIAVLDAFASGLFGGDANGICSKKIKGWLDELSEKPGFIETQRENWEKAILSKKSSVDESQFPLLTQYSSTWPQLKDSLEFAETHDTIYKYFSNIFNAKVENTSSLEAKIDEILDNLVNNFDNEELPLRSQLRKNKLVVEENGDLSKANSRFNAESKAYEEYEDFSQHLTSAALNPEASGALVATQKLSIALSKDWIIDAYEDLTAKSRANVPSDIEVTLLNWKGSTKDGSNHAELKESLGTYMDNMKAEELTKLTSQEKSIKTAWIIGIIIAVISIMTIVIPIISIAVTFFYTANLKKKIEKSRQDISENMDKQKENSLQILNGFLAEVVDYRRLYADKDKDSSKVVDLLNGLSVEQYITIQNAKKTRQLI